MTPDAGWETAFQDTAQADDFPRRVFLLGLGAVLLGGTGCQMLREQARNLTGPLPPVYAPLPKDAGALALAVHVLNRAAYGPKPGEAARVVEMGAAGWLEEQLAGNFEEDPTVTWRVNGLDVQQVQESSPDTLAVLPDSQLLTETQQAALLRAVYSRHQLREVLADFWTNHFNIYAIKNDGRILIPVDTERVIRPNLLGSFREMLFASARSSAMLAYLDNNLNKKGVANENYARELLELHTVGVHTGYTLKDIQEVARCFTGWTVQTGVKRGLYAYEADLHDEGAKFIPFLNLYIRPHGGQKDAETVLERLAAHPATGRYLATKLCERFLGTAPAEIVEKAANAYRTSQSDIRAMLRPILFDGLLKPEVNKPILKRPLEFVVASLRALAADSDCGANLQKYLADMGQPLYQWPMPDGFPTKAAAWTGSLLPRWNFALALAANAIPGTKIDLNAPLQAAGAHDEKAALDTLIETIYARPANSPELRRTKESLSRHMEKARQANIPIETARAEAAGLLLCAPEYQWR